MSSRSLKNPFYQRMSVEVADDEKEFTVAPEVKEFVILSHLCFIKNSFVGEKQSQAWKHNWRTRMKVTIADI